MQLSSVICSRYRSGRKIRGQRVGRKLWRLVRIMDICLRVRVIDSIPSLYEAP